jgi:hypothetical protein
MVVCGGAADARCQFSGYPFQYGMDVTYSGTCDDKGTMFSFQTGMMSIESLQITEPPRHGRAGVRRAEAGYLPAPGYHGKDRFVVRICGSNPLTKGCSNLTYDVTMP